MYLMFQEPQCLLNNLLFVTPVWYLWKNVSFRWLRTGLSDMLLILRRISVNNVILEDCCVIYQDALCNVDGQLRHQWSMYTEFTKVVNQDQQSYSVRCNESYLKHDVEVRRRKKWSKDKESPFACQLYRPLQKPDNQCTSRENEIKKVWLTFKFLSKASGCINNESKCMFILYSWLDLGYNWVLFTENEITLLLWYTLRAWFKVVVLVEPVFLTMRIAASAKILRVVCQATITARAADSTGIAGPSLCQHQATATAGL